MTLMLMQEFITATGSIWCVVIAPFYLRSLNYDHGKNKDALGVIIGFLPAESKLKITHRFAPSRKIVISRIYHLSFFSSEGDGTNFV